MSCCHCDRESYALVANFDCSTSQGRNWRTLHKQRVGNYLLLLEALTLSYDEIYRNEPQTTWANGKLHDK